MSWVLVLGLIFGSLFSYSQLNMNLDLRKFDYQSGRQKDRTTWFYSHFSESWPLIITQDRSVDLNQYLEIYNWSEGNQFRYEGIGKFISPPEHQSENKKTWGEACAYFKNSLSPEERKIFSPFSESLCANGDEAIQDLSARSYLKDFISQSQVVSAIFVRDIEQEKFVKARFPESESLRAVLLGFSDTLKRDLAWMIPTAMILVILILSFYYRRPLFVLSSLVPFLSGMGLVFLLSALFNKDVTVITLIGLIIVFGFSLDYGVFATDIYAFSQGSKNEKAVWSALGLAALTNILGFAPMLMAHHPVLQQLGFALFFGTIGTYVGSAWALPDLVKWGRKQVV